MVTKTWEQYHADIRKLGEVLVAYRPDILAPCMLGGLIPAAILARELEVKDVRPIDIERHGDVRRLAYDIQGDIRGRKVLILEDDIPSGKGVLYAKQIFEGRGAEVKIAAVYVNPNTQKVADFYAEVHENLPNYPHKQFHAGDRTRH